MDAMDTALSTLAERVQTARAHHRPLRIRGGGTKDFYGEALQGEVLDMRPLAGIVNYEPSELVATVRTGTRLKDLEEALAAQHQRLAFEPPHFGTLGTVGGMVAAGLSGPARASVGAVRDFVLGVQIMNGAGELLNFGGQVMKNVAGYDVSRLMAGALGTLGILTQVSLKVTPVEPAEVTLLFDFSETTARQQLNRWRGQPLPLSASCWTGGQLAVRLRGAQAAVSAAQRTMGGELLAESRTAAFWVSLRDQTAPFFRLAPGECLWRVSVRDTAPPLNLGPTLVEWHGAQRWVRLPSSAAEHIRVVASRAGGHATLFRGSRTWPVPIFTPLPAALARIHQRLKQTFDPEGILNPGRLMTEF